MNWVKSWYARFWAAILASLASKGGSAQQPVDPDTAAWEAARSADTYEAYQRYLIQFPVGAMPTRPSA